jgi:hypothetical protein
VGQITNPLTKGITVNPIDRESGPGAGAGATGNNSLFLGLNSGLNSAVNQLVILGGNSNGSGGIVDAVNLPGTTIVGTSNAPLLTAGTGGGFPLTIVGSNNLPIGNGADSTVLIGSHILSSWQGTLGGGLGLATSVLIGNSIFPNITGTAGATTTTVAIGYNIAVNATGFTSSNQCVVIGTSTIASLGANVSMVGCIYIGHGAASGASNPAQNVAIGVGTTSTTTGSNNVIVGNQAGQTGGAGGDQSNVVIGTTAQCTGSFNVVLGSRAVTSSLAANFGNVILGANAGSSLGATLTNIFLIEASTAIGGGTGNAPSTLLYGQFGTGNLILGASSVAGGNRDLGGGTGTNTVKLINGTIGGTNPSGGGYFYATAGNLHWVSSAGIDTQLNVSAAGQLAANAIAAYTNNAGAAVGTLTNAPAAGNPTKWIPINDNGTIRNIPAW